MNGKPISADNQRARANDLFLAMFNLSQMEAPEEKIIEVFLETVREIWPTVTITFDSSQPDNPICSIPIGPTEKQYGFLHIEGFDKWEEEDRTLVENACGMLAAFLRRQEQTLLLADERLRLSNLVDERTKHLTKKIEKHKKIETALLESEVQYRSLFETMIQGVVYQDREGYIVSANPAAERILGLTLQEMLSMTSMSPQWKSIREDGSELPGSEHPSMVALRTGKKVEGFAAGIFNARKNRHIWLLIDAIPQFLGEDRAPYRVFTTFLDITARKEAERAEQEAAAETYRLLDIANRSRKALLSVVEDEKRAREKVAELNEELEQRVAQRTLQFETANRELEAFSYSVSHDLRAPLRTIDGFVRILVEDFGTHLDSEGQRICSVIREGARKMGKLIDDLLTFSRVGRTAIEPSLVDMESLVRSVFLDLTTAEERQRIEFNVHALSPAVGDPGLLRQVWANLIGNAVKYSSLKSRAIIEIGNAVSVDEIIYSIADNGVGFDMQHAGKLFNVFQRLHSASAFEGTGAGLAIVHRIVLRHGGRTWAESAVDKGATFHFSIKKGG